MEKNKFPCGSEMLINSGNSDANCFRERPVYAVKLVKKCGFKICEGCVYKEIAEQALKEDKQDEANTD